MIAALEAALRENPTSASLRLHLAQVVLGQGDPQRALGLAVEVLTGDPADIQALRLAAQSAEAVGDTDRAAAYRKLLGGLEAPLADQSPSPDPVRSGPVGPPNDDQTFAEIVRDTFGEEVVDDRVTQDIARGEWEIERPTIRLADVAGMADVKRRLELAFLGPMRNPEVMKTFGMSLRGGLLLYGPPGCGKTFLARATAGELGTRFLGVGLSDVLDMYVGESERKLHSIFEEARRNAPCIVFFDEVDALGQKRTQLRTAPHYRRVVNQLLAELDGAVDNNEGVFVLAASNHPWDVDTALQRPGRLDRTMLVLPPDQDAREAIIRLHLRDRPAEGIDAARIAGQTDEFSGADLAHLCTSATERAMEDSLKKGQVRPVRMDDFRVALKEVHPSTRSWFAIAKNVATFANDGGAYDDLLSYIRAHRI